MRKCTDNRGAIASLIFFALLTACGGGGTSAVAPAAKTGLQSVTFSINIPGRSPAGMRRAQYIGGGTQSASIVVTPPTGTPAPAVIANCTTVCQTTLLVAPGSNTFSVNLLDGQNGTGSVLSTGTATQTIVAGSANSVNVTFNGIPATVALGAPSATFASGTPSTATFAAQVLDADGQIIVAPGTYTQSVTLASGQSYIGLSPTTITAPGTTVTASYDGTPVGTTTVVQISAAIGTGAPATAGSLTVQNGAPPPVQLTIDQPSVSVTSPGGTTVVTVTETRFFGTITADDSLCSTFGGFASVSPSSASGPSAQFTITGNSPTNPLPCTITFSDGGTGSTAVTVTVQ
jgi:hypothetical protein